MVLLPLPKRSSWQEKPLVFCIFWLINGPAFADLQHSAVNIYLGVIYGMVYAIYLSLLRFVMWGKGICAVPLWRKKKRYQRTERREKNWNSVKIARKKSWIFEGAIFSALSTAEIVYNDIGYNDEPDITTEWWPKVWPALTIHATKIGYNDASITTKPLITTQFWSFFDRL